MLEEAAAEDTLVQEINEARNRIAYVVLKGICISICGEGKMVCHASPPVSEPLERPLEWRLSVSEKAWKAGFKQKWTCLSPIRPHEFAAYVFTT